MAEVQQTSDATFRLFDWNRRDAQGKQRQLHIKEALACIDWRQGPVQPVRVRGYGTQAGRQRVSLVRCPYFTLEYVQESDRFACGGDGRLQALIVVRGRGRLETPAGEATLAVGQTWLLPASLPEAWCRPEGQLGVVLSTLPSAAGEPPGLSRRG
jgi:mannose-6-phosphate isomerase